MRLVIFLLPHSLSLPNMRQVSLLVLRVTKRYFLKIISRILLFTKIQGGPGGSSCGYGNFEIIGPINLDLEPRNQTWVSTELALKLEHKIVMAT